VFAFFAVVDLESVVVARDNSEFARVVEVERGNGGACTTRLEALNWLLAHRDTIEICNKAHSCWAEARYDVAHFLCRWTCGRGRCARRG
jgi:hypothetical protein